MTRTWAEAKNTCDGLKLGGYEDWRLPTVHELFFLVDVARFNPAIDPVFECRSSSYWTSNIVAGNPDQAWSLNFSGGLAEWLDKGLSHYVRCLRAVP